MAVEENEFTIGNREFGARIRPGSQRRHFALESKMTAFENDTKGLSLVAGLAGAEAGLVILDGPGSVAVTLTPAAAEKTAQSLYAAACEAREQVHIAGLSQ